MKCRNQKIKVMAKKTTPRKKRCYKCKKGRRTTNTALPNIAEPKIGLDSVVLMDSPMARPARYEPSAASNASDPELELEPEPEPISIPEPEPEPEP